MVVNRCPYCMEEIGYSTVCPYCHKNRNTANDRYFNTLPINSILHGRYLLGTSLWGSQDCGYFDITYIGFDLLYKKKVVIREYYPDGADRSNNKLVYHAVLNSIEEVYYARGLFLNEGIEAARISNIPFIIGVNDLFYDNNTGYIISDYVPGITLEQYIRNGRVLSFRKCVIILLPVLDGLAKLHAAGLVHRNINPSNIMLAPNGRAYLLDFGAAKNLPLLGPISDEGPLDKILSPFWPLERCDSQGKVGPWSDIYSLCATIYYAISRKKLPMALTGKSLEESLLLECGRLSLTKTQTVILQKGLAVQAESRIQSAVYLANLLRNSFNDINIQ